MQEQLDPESINNVMDAFYQSVRGAVESAGGTVVQLLGDGMLCAFGIPTIAEDDALCAVRAAVGIQQAFREFLQTQRWLTSAIGLRVAVNTGEVVVSDEHPAGIGDPLNVAARLQQEARDGEVLIGQATRRLVADTVTLERAGVFKLKGRTGTVTAYRVISLQRPTGTTATFVGREEEMARLTAVYDKAVNERVARLGMLVGSPGLGKSRLIDEFCRRVGDRATIVSAHCDAAGGATFAPIAEALREWLGAKGSQDDSAARTDPSAELLASIERVIQPEDTERARVAAGLLALLDGSPPSPEETFFVIRRFLSALAQERPLVLVIDDLHWAEPLLLDLVEHLIQWVSGVPLFLLVGARPELRERRSTLVTPDGLVSDVITLGGLDAGAAMRLAASVIGAADLPATVVAKVLSTSEGNPLFVGELVRMLVDEGAIEEQGGRWIVGANLAELAMPPTIHALLAARLERLHPEERTLLECASVVGRQFSRHAVAALLGQQSSTLDARLESLKRSELIESDTGWLLGEPLLRFHHVLIRDAAYRRLLKGKRAELHERLAGWIEAQVGSASEHDESIGRHLEQANLLLGELGPLDEKGSALGKRASQRLAAAGRRALARDDVSVASDLLGRAVSRLDPVDPGRAELTLDWCEALLSAGDVGPAAMAIDSLAGTNDRRLRAWRTCFAGQLAVLTAPEALQAAADSVADAAREFTELGVSAGQAKAHFVHAQALARLGKVGASEAALDLALAAAREAGDRRRANTVLALAPLAALWGPSPVTRASGRCLDVVRVLRITQGAPAVEAVALSCQGVLEALRGRTDAAHRMIASGRRMVEEMGIAQRLFETDVFSGFVELLEGNFPAAERTLRGAYEGFRALGLGIDAARAAALLARVLLLQDRIDEAETLSHASEALAGDDLKAAIAWRGVRAEALARRGEPGQAIKFASAAVAIATTTDALLDHADARRALAAAFRAAGRAAEAEAQDRHAIELWETKGATQLANSVRGTRQNVVNPRRPDESVQWREGANVTAHRRIGANVATRLCGEFATAIATRDLQMLGGLIAEDFHFEHRWTGTSFGSREFLGTWRGILDAQDVAYRSEVLAGLGESLALYRHLLTIDGLPKSVIVGVGQAELDEVVIVEADRVGQCCRMDLYAPAKLGNAITGLFERHAESLPQGPERTRASGVARVIAAHNGPIDPDRIRSALDPAHRCVDHRDLGTWNTASAAEIVHHYRTQLELAPDFSGRIDDVLALAPDALTVLITFLGTARSSGGAFENKLIVLFTFGADGLNRMIEYFEPEQVAEALTRFDELATRTAPGVGREFFSNELFSNMATRAVQRGTAAIASRDWQAFAALMAPGFRHLDRTRIAHLETDGQAWLAGFRRMVEMTSAPPVYSVLATRGEWLALMSMIWRGADGDVGLSEIEWRLIIEVNQRGEHVAIVVYDPVDVDAAYGELDVRYRAKNASASDVLAADQPEQLPTWKSLHDYVRHVGCRDWSAVAALCAEEFVEFDHRSFATLGTTRGGDAWARNFQELVSLAPDTVYRVHHVLIEARGYYSHGSWVGTRDGGPYEIVVNAVLELDESGLLLRADIFDGDDGEEALKRLAELAVPASST